MNKDILAAGIIYRREKKQIKFVLIQDRFGKWTFPKGKILGDEAPENTVLRESLEETNLKKLKIRKYLTKIRYEADQRKKVVYFYLIESFDDKKGLFIRPNNKERIKKAIWQSSPGVKKMLGYGNFIPCFNKALDYLKNYLF